jgi:predicted ester cyclase
MFSFLQTDTMSFYSAYSESEIKPVMQQIAASVQKADTGKHTAIYNKYSSSKFGKISKYPELKGPVIAKVADSS